MEFRDLKAQYKALKPDIDNAIQDILNAGTFIGGAKVEELETNLADYAGVKHCISCANGTDALSLVLMAWNIGEGDAVFVPDFTFFATGEAVSYEGATPIFVDVDADTFNIDADKLEEAILKTIKEAKRKPKAIIPVDLFGLPADYSKIEQLAQKYGLLVLEDGAQGFGGMMDGRRVCSFGEAATTSFFPAKPLGCYGDGGAIFTNDDRVKDVVESLKVHGKGHDKYENVRIGINSRLDTLQAAILGVKFNAFKQFELNDVNHCANRYTQELESFVKVPRVPAGYVSSWAQYTITLESKAKRDRLQARLKERGVPTMVYYPKPLHMQEAFAYLQHQFGGFPVSEMLCDCVLSLPIGPYLKMEQQDIIIKIIKEELTF